MGTLGSVMVSKIDKETFTREFDSRWLSSFIWTYATFKQKA